MATAECVYTIQAFSCDVGLTQGEFLLYRIYTLFVVDMELNWHIKNNKEIN